MVSFKFKDFLKDKRNKFIKLNLYKYLKKRYPQSRYLWEKFKNLDDIIIWQSPYPCETIILTFYFSNIIFYTNSRGNHTNLTISISNKSYYYFILFLRLSWSKLYFPIDMTLIQNFLYGIFSCYFDKNFLILNSNFSSQNFLYSISTLYSSCIWMERELKEFSNMYIYNLKDTRRLLTDYTNFSAEEKYKTTSYNFLTQDLYYQ